MLPAFRKYWASIFSAIGPFCLGVAGIMRLIYEKKWDWSFGSLIVLGILLTVSGALGKLFYPLPGEGSQIIRAEANAELANDAEIIYKGFIGDELYILSRILNFSGTERISLYRDDCIGLSMIGRYSRNTEFHKKGNGVQDYGVGIVGKSWVESDGIGYVNDLPEDPDAYVNECKQHWNMDPAQVRLLRMKSRTICVRPVRNDKGHKIAVLVFESMKEKGFTEGFIDQIMGPGRELERMRLILERRAQKIPSLQVASQEGL